MATLIQIKRSSGTSTPTSLGDGELAYSANGDVLYIGSPDGANTVTAIGGARTPGTLTANQALVANSSSALNNIILGALAFTGTNQTLTANGSVGTGGQILASGGAGSNLYWTASGGGGTVTSVDTGDGLTGGEITGAGTISLVAADGLTANSSGAFVQAGNNQLSANSTGLWLQETNITHDNLNGFVGNEHIDHSGVSITAGAGLTGGGTIAATRTVDVGAGDGITVNANDVAVDGANGISVTADGVNVEGSTGVTVTASGVAIGQDVATTSQVTFDQVTTTNDMIVGGDLVVNGNTTQIDVETLTVTDSLLKLASNNDVADTIDTGFYSVYENSGDKFTGLFRDASDGKYKLFTGLTPEPSSTVDTGGAGYTVATLVAAIESSSVTITGGSVTGITDLTVADGGTGVSSFTDNGVLYGDGSNALDVTAAGSEGQVLQAGASGVPEFNDLDGGSF